MRVLILAHDFPPLNSIGARRPNSWFNYFKEFGVAPIIITKSWDPNSGSVREILSHEGNEEVVVEDLPQGKIIRVPIRKILPERIYAHYGEERWTLFRKFLSLI